MPDVTGATTSLTDSISNALSSSGLASGLSSVKNAITGIFGSTNKSTKPSGVKLPLANPLMTYASYDYIIGIGVLSPADYANPDSTYMKGVKSNGQPTDLILKSANADPNNRVKTAFGKFDYFVDNLEIVSNIGLENGSTSNMLSMTFTVMEPYSMGGFLQALQTAAWAAGHSNYQMAPYLLTIDFRGSTETGSMVSVPKTSRKIPFQIKDVEMKVNEKGSTYEVTAYPPNYQALGSRVAQLKTDVSVSGSTVQEVLQTGEKSLQTVINKRLKDQARGGLVKIPDEIIILFPTDTSSAALDKEKDNTKKDQKATNAKPKAPAGVDAAELAKQLGVTRSKTNSTFVQTTADCNELGKAKLGFDEKRKADNPFGKDSKLYDPDLKSFVRGKNLPKVDVNDYRFAQNSDILNAINQVLLSSEYANKALAAGNITPEGQRQWWRIDTKVYYISSEDNMAFTGTLPRLIVYQIVPYLVHTSKIVSPNTKAPGFEELKKQVVKVYDYIYTGKNTEVLSFNINFKMGFAGVMGAGTLADSVDVKRSNSEGGTTQGKPENIKPLPTGKAPNPSKPSNPNQVTYTQTNTNTDNKGGGGPDNQATRAARMFHQALTNGSDMINLDLNIIGDPYFIAQSGQGNYTSAPTEKQNLNADGSVNYQNGEVDIIINFRTPVDINQTTGLYDFGKSSKTAPVLQWSGLYQVINVTSKFSNGQFTQSLTGTRRANQELPDEATPTDTFSNSNTSKTAIQQTNENVLAAISKPK